MLVIRRIGAVMPERAILAIVVMEPEELYSRLGQLLDLTVLGPHAVGTALEGPEEDISLILHERYAEVELEPVRPLDLDADPLEGHAMRIERNNRFGVASAGDETNAFHLAAG